MAGRILTASTLVALAQAKAIITNNCYGPVWIWSVPTVGSEYIQSRVIVPGSRYEEPWRYGTSEHPGIALKVSNRPNGIHTGDELDFAYNIEPSDNSKVWIDLSPVRGKFGDQDRTLTLSFHTCHGVSHSLDFKTQKCHATDNIELVLCGSARSTLAKDTLALDEISECYNYDRPGINKPQSNFTPIKPLTKSQTLGSSSCKQCAAATTTVTTVTTMTTTAKPITYEPYHQPPPSTSSHSYQEWLEPTSTELYHFSPKFTSTGPYHTPSKYISKESYAQPPKQITTTATENVTVTKLGYNSTVNYQPLSHAEHKTAYAAPPKHTTEHLHSSPPKPTPEKPYNVSHSTQPYAKPPQYTSTSVKGYAAPPQYTSTSVKGYAVPPQYTSTSLKSYAAPQHTTEQTHDHAHKSQPYAQPPQHTSTSAKNYAAPPHYTTEHAYDDGHKYKSSSQPARYTSESVDDYPVPPHHTKEHAQHLSRTIRFSSHAREYTAASVDEYSEPHRPSHSEPIDRPERPTKAPVENYSPHAPDYFTRGIFMVNDDKVNRQTPSARSLAYCKPKIVYLSSFKPASNVNDTSLAPRTLSTVQIRGATSSVA